MDWIFYRLLIFNEHWVISSAVTDICFIILMGILWNVGKKRFHCYHHDYSHVFIYAHNNQKRIIQILWKKQNKIKWKKNHHGNALNCWIVEFQNVLLRWHKKPIAHELVCLNHLLKSNTSLFFPCYFQLLYLFCLTLRSVFRCYWGLAFFSPSIFHSATFNEKSMRK